MEPQPRVLPPGDYLWCGCGGSAKRPLCDGRHAGNGCSAAHRFTVTPRSGRLWLCVCQRTRHPPFCDGQHNRR